jgi:hypothetical protein
VNKELFERIASRHRNKHLNDLFPSLIARFKEDFFAQFQNYMFDNEEQIMEKFNSEFLDTIDNCIEELSKVMIEAKAK